MKQDVILATSALWLFVGINAWLWLDSPSKPAEKKPGLPTLSERFTGSRGGLRPVAEDELMTALKQSPLTPPQISELGLSGLLIESLRAGETPPEKLKPLLEAALKQPMLEAAKLAEAIATHEWKPADLDALKAPEIIIESLLAGEPLAPRFRARLAQHLGWRRPASTGDSLGIIIAAGLTLITLSFLYRDNPFFRVAEHVLVGASVAVLFKSYYYDVIRKKLFDKLFIPLFAGEPIDGVDWLLVIPTVLSLFLMLNPTKKFYWVSRWSFAVIIGMAAGVEAPQIIDTMLLKQIQGGFDYSSSVIRVLHRPEGVGDFFGQFGLVLNMLLVTVGMLCVLSYFFFSVEHRGWLGRGSKVGIWILMISFGASFGYTVMGRLSLFVQRLNFLLFDWLHL